MQGEGDTMESCHFLGVEFLEAGKMTEPGS